MSDIRSSLRPLQPPMNRYAPSEIPTAVAREARKDKVFAASLDKGRWVTLPRLIWCRNAAGKPVMKEVRIWRRNDAQRLARSDFVTAEGGEEIGRGLGYTFVIMPGERLGMFTGMNRANFDLAPTKFALTLDAVTVLECSMYARYYCIPSHCNDYRALRNRYTGTLGQANCELVRGDGDDVWLVATRMMLPGPRGYTEALTFYGDEWDELHML
ncbi:hypothetical protein B484DRAFT_448237 [Ochromonadaceae sp. CCMP2298]|nr:hypothetical protein B484DRAFT_448242 [Ochromonadaceae sp. CCMP2298]KAJ1431685.1 hypothetical protein B484DRAFT_448237 [Ochromonadaceae sp. CCMP2298]|mmetsp:Transcript_4908/g.11120  ORF Transcript_4908/g.11120 Transcript_4908/m.11120 type:complete len:213 (+) Transcript_4908:23-661(+)